MRNKFDTDFKPANGNKFKLAFFTTGKYVVFYVAAAFYFFFYGILYSQDNVGIGTNSPNSSAALDIVSTTKGLLIPRMTSAERDAINGGAPPSGLMIYNTSAQRFEYFNGSAWTIMLGAASPAWVHDGNATTSAWNGTAGSYLGASGTQPLVIATTNATAQRMEFWTGNELRMRIMGNGRIGLGVGSPVNYFDIEQPNDATLGSGSALSVVRDNDGSVAASTAEVVKIVQDNTADQHAALRVKQDGVPAPASGIELPSVYSEVSANTTEQAIALWGDARGGSGTIGVLATGNANASTNSALQVNDGEFTMGRTTNSPGGYTVVEPADGGTDYTQEGPSGVIQLSLGGGDLNTSAPTTGALQDIGSVMVSNDYAKPESIININIVDVEDDGSAPNPSSNAFFIINIINRGAGNFTIHVGMIPNETNGANYSISDNIKIGYVIINPGK